MALIQFTRNYTDHSTDKGYQFEFFCDRCGSGFKGEFKPSMLGVGSSVLRAAGDFFGGFLGRAGHSTYHLQDAVRGPAHDKAYRECIEEAKPNFRLCPKCSNWACLTNCWNEKRGLCYDCAPNLETELAAAQATSTVDQMREKVREQDLTAGLDLTTDASARCPHCGVRAAGGKFCPDCGKPLRPKVECKRCGCQSDAGTRFCPECGDKLI